MPARYARIAVPLIIGASAGGVAGLATKDGQPEGSGLHFNRQTLEYTVQVPRHRPASAKFGSLDVNFRSVSAVVHPDRLDGWINCSHKVKTIKTGTRVVHDWRPGARPAIVSCLVVSAATRPGHGYLAELRSKRCTGSLQQGCLNGFQAQSAIIIESGGGPVLSNAQSWKFIAYSRESRAFKRRGHLEVVSFTDNGNTVIGLSTFDGAGRLTGTPYWAIHGASTGGAVGLSSDANADTDLAKCGEELQRLKLQQEIIEKYSPYVCKYLGIGGGALIGAAVGQVFSGPEPVAGMMFGAGVGAALGDVAGEAVGEVFADQASKRYDESIADKIEKCSKMIQIPPAADVATFLDSVEWADSGWKSELSELMSRSPAGNEGDEDGDESGGGESDDGEDGSEEGSDQSSENDSGNNENRDNDNDGDDEGNSTGPNS